MIARMCLDLESRDAAQGQREARLEDQKLALNQQQRRRPRTLLLQCLTLAGQGTLRAVLTADQHDPSRAQTQQREVWGGLGLRRAAALHTDENNCNASTSMNSHQLTMQQEQITPGVRLRADHSTEHEPPSPCLPLRRDVHDGVRMYG